MKTKKLIIVFTCAFLLLGGGTLLAAKSASKDAKKVKAATDVGEIEISEVRNAISTASVTYLLPTQNYSLPDSWDYAYAGVGDDDGVFINGEKQVGAVLIYAGTGSAFTTFYYGLPSAAVEGDVVEFKGTFATESDGGWSFSIHYVTQRFANQWVHKLEAYDTVSLADANMPDFENVAVNTEDDASYAYTTDPYALPTRKGYFGITNDTGSYAFQFLFTKTVQSGGFVEVRIGGTGSWGTGHFIKYTFSNEWATRGCAFVEEYQGNGDIWSPTKLQTSPEFIPELTGNENLIEFGAIKVAGSSQYLMFFKNNNAVLWSAYWTLDSAARTTRVGIFYNQADAKFNNTIDIEAAEKIHTSNDSMDSLYTAADICPAVHDWSTYFMSVDGNGLKLNGVPFGSNHWNYFKKTGACNYYLDVAAATGSASLQEGDVLSISGVFKGAKTTDGALTLYKVVFEESLFEYYAGNWYEFTTQSLQEAKESFKADLDEIDLDLYREAERAQMVELIAQGKEAIDAATGLRTLQDRVNENYFARQQIKTDDELSHEEADAFGALVDAIGEVTLEKEMQIRQAQNAYDELNATAKGYASAKIAELDQKVNRLNYLKREKAKAENVEALIAAIPNLTRTNYDEDAHLVGEAREAYDALSEEGKGYVTNLNLLQGAEGRLADLDAAIAVDQQIVNIGTVTLAKEQQIINARAAYDALSANENRWVLYLSTLEAAEARLAELKQEKANAEYVDELINQIGQVDASSECAAKITNARAAYEALNEEEKSMVTGLTTLQAVEAEFATALAQAKDAGKASVDEVHDALNLSKYSSRNKELIEQLTADAKSAIDEAHSSDEIAQIVADYEAAIAAVPQKQAAKKGCGGSIVATSIILSTLALAGLGLAISKKRKED